MEETADAQRWNTVIIGGGQAGLAVGYYLTQRGESFVILEKEDRLGNSWRHRWDSLTLFTPAKYDGLPGLRFPKSGLAFPTKDEMADYLEAYAKHFSLPVRLRTPVIRLEKRDDGFEIRTKLGVYRAANVVVTTGANHSPWVPDFVDLVDKDVVQLHSSQYRRPDQLPPGEVLVVGAATSGIEIALELSKARTVAISGQVPMKIPDRILRLPFYWALIKHLLTISTPLGRRMKKLVNGHGAPLIRVSSADLDRAKIQRLPRVTSVSGGRVVLEGGKASSPAAIVWATGFKNDFTWIDFPIGDLGKPLEHRGVSLLVDGLFFVGLPFQFGLVSGLVGGMGRDAAYVVRRILRRRVS